MLKLIQWLRRFIPSHPVPDAVTLKFHPFVQRFLPWEPRMRPIYEAVAARGKILYFHTGFEALYESPLPVSETFPDRIMFGSDHPAGMGSLAQIYQDFYNFGLSERAQRALLGETARRLVEQVAPGRLRNL